MRRADRLFDIIQRLRTARGPLTAATIAEQLEVTVRTVYRDIAALQARRVPIEGAAGIGYVLRRGFDLPPLMFTTEETRRHRRWRPPGAPAARPQAAGSGRQRAGQGHDGAARGAARAGARRAAVCLQRQRAGGRRDRSRRGAQRDPCRAEAAHRLSGCAGPPHATDDLADRDGVLRRRDPDRCLVRAAQRFPPFPSGSDHHVNDPRRTVSRPIMRSCSRNGWHCRRIARCRCIRCHLARPLRHAAMP